MDMIKTPSLSIVVPCYNVENVIEKCIKALLVQDYPDDKFSIVLIDDKSTDKTLEIINKYKNNFYAHLICLLLGFR